MLCWAVASLPGDLASARLSRRRERAADAYAAALAGPEPPAAALERLCATNLAELQPPALERPRASHPPLGERIRRLRSPPRGEGDPGGAANAHRVTVSLPVDRPQVVPPLLRVAAEPVIGRPRVIALANQKGGVAKTTSTVNLGVALRERGKRVLAVDLDPQANLTMSMGLDPETLERSMFDVLVSRVPIRDVVHERELHVAAASIDLAGAELALAAMIGRERALAKALMGVEGDYDYVLVDTPPSLGLLTVNALTAADGVIVPVQCEYLSLRGLVQLEATLQMIREHLNPRVRIRGILPTMLDTRLVHAREALSLLEANFGPLVYRTRIRKTVRLAEAPVQGSSVIAYDPAGPAAAQYRALAEEVLRDAEEAG